MSGDGTWLYVGDDQGNVTALPIELWDGNHERLPFDHTGGCLSGTGKTVPCPATLTLGSAVRDMQAM